MRKFGVAVAVAAAVVLLAGSLAWKAQATGAVGPNTLPAMVKTFSLVEKTACRTTGKHCPPGYVWTCGPARCWCAPC